MSSIYGAEHLLRLFGLLNLWYYTEAIIYEAMFSPVRLGSVLAYTTVDEDGMTILLSHIHNFLKYMQTKKHDLFKGAYEVAPPDYCRKAV
jgi:mortality factor 4-like protein 1